MLITFSHIVNNNRIPLLDDEGREVTLSVEASTRTDAVNSQAVKDLIDSMTDKVDIRVRRVN